MFIVLKNPLNLLTLTLAQKKKYKMIILKHHSTAKTNLRSMIDDLKERQNNIGLTDDPKIDFVLEKCCKIVISKNHSGFFCGSL